MTIKSIYIIYIGIILCILSYIFKCIYVYAWGYKLVSINYECLDLFLNNLCPK